MPNIDSRLIDWHETMLWLDNMGAPHASSIIGRIIGWKAYHSPLEEEEDNNAEI